MVSLLALLPFGASGAVISWGSTGQLYTGNAADESFISTNGTLVEAVNGGGTTETANGVTFTGFVGANGTADTSPGGFITVNGAITNANAFTQAEFGNNAVGNLIHSALWSADRVILNNLIVGNLYEIQILMNDARGNRSVNFIGGVGDGTLSGTPAANLLLNNSPADGSAPVLPQSNAGDFITGTFTADATSQSFDVYGTNSGNVANLAIGDSRAHVNALQLRTDSLTPGILMSL